MKDNRFGKVLAFIRQEQLVHNGDRVLIACSGGVDSVALLYFFYEHRIDMNIALGVIHVDHCLRGEESAIDGKVVADICEQLAIPFYGKTLPVPDLLAANGGNLQDVCRRGRYSLFEKTMLEEGYTNLAIAHHAEDQLETMLMQLAQGRRPRGMPTHRTFGGGQLIRPLLPLMKKDLYEYVDLRNLPYREDPSNQKDDYTRNRYRHHIVPVLLTEHELAAENSVRVATALQEDDAFLTDIAKEHLERLLTFTDTGIPVIHSKDFRSMHVALQKRVVPLVLKYLYNGQTIPAVYNSDLVNQLIFQLSEDAGSASISLPNKWIMQREYGVSSFVRDEEEESSNRIIPFPPNEWIHWGQMKLRWCKASAANVAALVGVTDWRYFQLEEELPSIIRSRRSGDRIQLSGMDQPKRVTRLLIDEKVNQSERDRLPIILNGQGQVLAIPGIRYSATFTKKPSAEQAYILMMVWPE